eukprot:XP_798905.2 PREDICTED: pyridoxal phosphate phosphatase PHOSPHO2-like [Strongylocentrotus purpuratus]
MLKHLSMASAKRVVPRVLLAFDCDHTIIDGNSDTWIISLLPDHTVPKDIKKRYKTEHNSWTIYMGEIFKYMHLVDIGEVALHESIAGIPLTPGMKELFDYQASCSQLDCIVVSDSNSFFIDAILGSRNFQKGVSKIYTNQAEFDSDGCLKIHFSNPHSCPRKCPKNLCKQTCLQAFVEEQKAKGVEYDRICMIGDGRNDFCPCFCLKERDYVFPRKGFSLVKLLQEQKEKKGSNDECIKATVLPWDTATEILAVVKSFFEH